MVNSLKTNGMPRSNPCFKKAYVKLFDLSKLFLKVSLEEGSGKKAEIFTGLFMDLVLKFLLACKFLTFDYYLKSWLR